MGDSAKHSSAIPGKPILPEAGAGLAQRERGRAGLKARCRAPCVLREMPGSHTGQSRLACAVHDFSGLVRVGAQNPESYTARQHPQM